MEKRLCFLLINIYNNYSLFSVFPSLLGDVCVFTSNLALGKDKPQIAHQGVTDGNRLQSVYNYIRVSVLPRLVKHASY